MDSPINKIDELLSGMLDGVLTGAESRELGGEMAKDPSLERRLDELAMIRKSLMGGRSRKALRPDFASSVTVAARKRTAEMGDAGPNWLQPGPVSDAKSNKTLAPSAWFPEVSHRLLYAGALSLAAIFAIVFFAIPKLGLKKPEGQAIVSLPIAEPPQNEKAATNFPASDSTAIVESGDGPLTDPAPAPIVEMLAQTELLSDPASRTGAELVLDSKEKTDATQVGMPKADALVNIAPKENPTRGKLPFFIVVLDISVDPQAVENRALERLLEKYGIVYTDDLVLNDEQIQNLERTKWVGKPDGDMENLGVLFLRSTASRLGSAIQEISENTSDFPDFGMDMAMDNSARLLVDQLSSIQVVENSGGYASRLQHPASRGNPLPFIASSSRSKPLSQASRGKFNGSMVSVLPDHQEMSNILILLRPAKK